LESLALKLQGALGRSAVMRKTSTSANRLWLFVLIG
jgi:hypothetical protein